MKTTVALIFFAISAFAQQGPAQLGPHAACGPVGVNFKTETSIAQSLPQPEPGKALVYVVEDFPGSSETIGAPTIKVGIDGNWVGATQGRSYLFFTADPGEHHLCVNWQSRWEGISKLASFAHVDAEPGKTYYFRARAIYYSHSPIYLDLDAIDQDEGIYLVASSQLSNAKMK
jgi:hypothetical protein